MFKWLFLFIFLPLYISGTDNKSTTIQWIAPCELTKSEKLAELQSVYWSAFKIVYKEYITEEFLKNLNDILNAELESFKAHEEEMFLCIAQRDRAIVGFVLFEKINKTTVSLELVAVEPTCWRQGIGKQLVFSILDKDDNIKTIKVVSYKINKNSPKFYKKLGFVETEYMHTGYSPEEFQGYEYTKKECA